MSETAFERWTSARLDAEFVAARFARPARVDCLRFNVPWSHGVSFGHWYPGVRRGYCQGAWYEESEFLALLNDRCAERTRQYDRYASE